MNCKEFRQQLDSIEGEGRASNLLPAMQAHLDACVACRAQFRTHHQMLTVLERDTAPALPPNFTESILARLEPVTARQQAKLRFAWKRVAVYSGYAFLLVVALWFGFKNLDAIFERQQLPQLPNEQQLQKLVDKIGAAESLQSFKRLASTIFSFIPAIKSLIEQSFGKKILPQAVQLFMILMMTYVVAKVAIFIDERVRQISRRSS
jgi:hypothetical protein